MLSVQDKYNLYMVEFTYNGNKQGTMQVLATSAVDAHRQFLTYCNMLGFSADINDVNLIKKGDI